MEEWTNHGKEPLGCVFLLLVLLLPLASADLVSRFSSPMQAHLQTATSVLPVGAVSPDGKDVLIGGMNGYARLLSAEEADNREMDVELVTERTPPCDIIAPSWKHSALDG